MNRDQLYTGIISAAHKLCVCVCLLLASFSASAQCSASINKTNNSTGNVSFTANVTGSVSGSTYTWKYGDGTFGSGLLTNHTYSANGTYLVSFTITSPPSCTFVKVDTAYVFNAYSCGLAASFNSTISNGGSASFASTSTGTNPGTSYIWSFGNSTTVTAGPVVTHVYPANGLYTATLKISNNATCTATYSSAIDVDSAGCTMKANFTHLTGPGGLVTFADASQSVTPGTSYLWNFGDGVISSSVNPTHTYANAGTHYVSLELKNGNCKDSIVQAINITGIGCKANSGFDLSFFSDSIWTARPAYPWNVTAARWDWGDGSSSHTLYPTHFYTTAGFYTICLTVTVSCDSVSTTCVYLPDKKVAVINIRPPGLTTGIQQAAVADRSLLIYPNPSSGLFTLELNGSGLGQAELTVYSLAGDLILRHYGSLSSQEPEEIDLSHIAEGIYFLRISSGNYTSTKKLIISR